MYYRSKYYTIVAKNPVIKREGGWNFRNFPKRRDSEFSKKKEVVGKKRGGVLKQRISLTNTK